MGAVIKSLRVILEQFPKEKNTYKKELRKSLIILAHTKTNSSNK